MEKHAQGLFEILKQYAMDLETVCGSVGSELPFALTAEHIATLPLIVDNVRDYVPDYQRLVEKIEKWLSPLNEIREDQEKLHDAC